MPLHREVARVLDTNRVLYRYRVNTATWTPSVAFAIVLHLLIGLSYVLAALQHVAINSVYTVVPGPLWLVGVAFVAAYVYAVAFPLWGGVIAVCAISAVGLIASIDARSVLGAGLYLALPFFAVTTTRHKVQLRGWVIEKRAVYDAATTQSDQESRDLATVNQVIADELAQRNLEAAQYLAREVKAVAERLATSNRDTAETLATSNRETAANLSQKRRVAMLDLMDQLRVCHDEVRLLREVLAATKGGPRD